MGNSGVASQPKMWTPFQRVENAAAIAQGLAIIPAHWSLTPLWEKRAYRDRWQSEPFVPHSTLTQLLLYGERRISKHTGNPYTAFISGYGLRLGEASNGLIAIDVDGASAEPILQAISNGNLPETVTWISGKPGRRQLLYQVPDNARDTLQTFRRTTLTRHGNLATVAGEMLELRYNGHQSALPPSRHPETIAYRWLRSPADTEVALAPDWLCASAIASLHPERSREIGKKEKRSPAPKRAIGWIGESNLEAILERALTQLEPEEIFNWPGHRFRPLGKTWRGFCPQHESHSGTAFTVDPETGEWYCFGCEVGGGATQYRHFLNGGRGTPSGKDFVAIVRELASDAGVECPEPKPSVSDRPPATDASEFESSRFKSQGQSECNSQLRLASGDRAKATWEQSKTFTPTHAIEQPYFSWETPEEGTLTAVKSGLGTGKTRWMASVVAELAEEGWVALGHRNSLLLQSCQRWGFYHLHSDDAFMLIPDPQSKIALCVDSLLHFRPEDFEDKNIILDEAMAVVRHLLIGGTLKQHRDAILQRFAEALQLAKRIFCLDGMLADWCIDYLHQLAGERAILKIENCHRSTPLEVAFLTESIGDKNKAKLNDRSPLLEQLWRSPHPVICTDSQLEAEALDRLLQKSGRRGMRIDSKTISEQETRRFLRDPDSYIRDRAPNYLIYTPSAEAGIDISIRDYFSDQFCLFFGVLHTDAQVQMLWRIRDPQVKRWLWVRRTGLPDNTPEKSPFPQQVAKAMEAFLIQEGMHSLNGTRDPQALEQLLRQAIAASRDEHYQAYCILKAIGNFESSHLRDCLHDTLAATGHRVQAVRLAEASQNRELEKQAKDEVKIGNARAIHTAETSIQDAFRSRATLVAGTPEERDRAQQLLLKQRLPGIERSPRWTPEFIKRVQYDDRQFIARQELFWLLSHPEVAYTQLQANYDFLAREERTFLGDVRSHSSKLQALLALKVGDLFDLGKEWTARDPKVIILRDRGRAKHVRAALGIRTPIERPIGFLRRVLNLVGLKLEQRRIRIDGEPISLYRLSREAWYDRDRLAVLECLERRFLQVRSCKEAIRH